MRTLLLLMAVLALGCDVNQERVHAWYAKRYATPGTSVNIELGVLRVLRGQVLKVEATAPELGLPPTVVFNQEQAPGFGMFLQIKRDDRIKTEVVSIPVPPGAAPGPAALTLRVNYRAAESSGPGQFKVVHGEETLALRVHILQPGLRGWLRRGADLALPLLILVGVGLACGYLNPLDNQPRWRAAAMVLLGLGWCATAYGGFIQPFSWAFGITTAWVRGLIGALGLGFWVALAAAVTEQRADTRPAP